MKKILLSVVCLIVVAVQSAMAQNAKIILHHEGTVSIFRANQTNDALTAAVDGDTIYFNSGTFIGDITITKRVALIGAGDNQTLIKGYVDIAIENNTDALVARIMDGLYIDGDIRVNKAVKGMVIRKCTFQRIFFTDTTEESVIDRCWSLNNDYRSEGGIVLSSYVKGLIVNNSKMRTVTGDCYSSEAALFTNCNIYRLYFGHSTGKKLATYRNCIIEQMDFGDSYYDMTTTYINCLTWHLGNMEKSAAYNCYGTGLALVDDNTDCKLSDAELLEKGFVGTDGKPVGITGGETPFTLTTNTPKITDYSTVVDPETLQVTVNLKVTNK